MPPDQRCHLGPAVSRPGPLRGEVSASQRGTIKNKLDAPRLCRWPHPAVSSLPKLHRACAEQISSAHKHQRHRPVTGCLFQNGGAATKSRAVSTTNSNSTSGTAGLPILIASMSGVDNDKLVKFAGGVLSGPALSANSSASASHCPKSASSYPQPAISRCPTKALVEATWRGVQGAPAHPGG